MSGHILVVDDNQTILSLLRELLEEEAYEVDTASDGWSAWKMLTRSSADYEVIMLDLHMPEMDGLQFIRMVHSRRGSEFLRSILVMSSDEDGIEQARSLGISHVLTKPFELEAVLSEINSCMLERSSQTILS